MRIVEIAPGAARRFLRPSSQEDLLVAGGGNRARRPRREAPMAECLIAPQASSETPVGGAGDRHHDLAIFHFGLFVELMSVGQTDLDTHLGRLQHRMDILDAGRILLGDRRARLAHVVVAAGGGRHEFHHDVLPVATDQALDGTVVENALGDD